MATGMKTGGRRKGTPNRRTAEMRAEMAATGEMPLDYMLRLMRDPNTEPARRDAMAKAAAPYLHPQLSSITQRRVNADGSPVGPTIINHFEQRRPEAPAPAETGSDVSDRRH
jgi:hypothetical protein